MTIQVNIPSALRAYTQNKSTLSYSGETVQTLLDQLTENHPDLKKHLFQEDGTLRSFVNLYVNDEDIRHQNQMETALKSGDEVNIIPSIAGGCLEI